MKLVGRSIGTIVVAFIYWLVYYFTLPTLSLAYFDGFMYIGIGVIIAIVLIVWWVYAFTYEKKIFIVPSAVAIIFFILVTVICAIAGMDLFHSKELYN